MRHGGRWCGGRGNGVEIVSRGVAAFVETGRALREIRDQRLYRVEGYGSFVDYLKERHGLSESRGYQLIDSADIAVNVSTNGGESPANERQCRELHKVEPQQRQAVWQKATAKSEQEGKPVTAKMIPNNAISSS